MDSKPRERGIFTNVVRMCYPNGMQLYITAPLKSGFFNTGAVYSMPMHGIE